MKRRRVLLILEVFSDMTAVVQTMLALSWQTSLLGWFNSCVNCMCEQTDPRPWQQCNFCATVVRTVRILHHDQYMFAIMFDLYFYKILSQRSVRQWPVTNMVTDWSPARPAYVVFWCRSMLFFPAGEESRILFMLFFLSYQQTKPETQTRGNYK